MHGGRAIAELRRVVAAHCRPKIVDTGCRLTESYAPVRGVGNMKIAGVPAFQS